MNKTLSILLVGASGRMGQEILLAVERIRHAPLSAKICGGIVSSGSKLLGKSIPGIESPLQSDWDPSFASADVIVDYSSDAGATVGLRIANEHRLPMLMASTGLRDETYVLAQELSEKVPVIVSANTSLVVTAMCRLVREAAGMLEEGFDVELMEVHHRMKKDAPSGTALLLLSEVAKAQGTSLSEVLEAGRLGHQALRSPGSIGAASLRGGDVAGEHTVYFFGDGERLEITQRATTRRVFADGALRAARWLREQAKIGPGMFCMEDVLLRQR